MSEDNGSDEITDRVVLDLNLTDDPDLFGDYAVLSPGVHIILDGRPFSRPR